jgi:hypothetical protein
LVSKEADMGRCTVAGWAFVAGLLTFCGCTAPKTFSPFGWMSGSNSAQASASADKPNPLKQDAASNDSTTSSADAAADAKASAEALAQLDPALRKAMEDELQSEAPAERARLMKQWAKFDPSFIRELIDSHRMSRELAEGKKQPPIKLAQALEPDTSGQPGDFDMTKPVPGSNGTRASDARAASTTGSLGTVSPWNDTPDTKSTPTASIAPIAPTPLAAPQRPGLDAFDTSSSSSPGSNQQPLVIAPATRMPSQPTMVAAGTLPQPLASPPGPAGPVGAASSDPFGDIAGDTPKPAMPKLAAAAPNAASPTGLNSAAGNSGGPTIQPGVDVPANVASQLGTPARTVQPTAAASGSSPAANASPSPFDPPATMNLIPPASAASASPPRSGQPVQLGAPTAVPTATVSPDAFAELPGSAQQEQPSASAPPANPAAPGAPAANLPNFASRLLGGIMPKDKDANAPHPPTKPVKWRDELQKVVATVASEAAQTSVGTTDAEKLAYIEKQVQLRMLYLLAGQPARSLDPIPGLDPADQEFWQQVFWSVSNYFDSAAMADPGDRAAQTIAQLRTAVHRLQEKSKLELRNVAFCHKITNYGNYERFKRDEFTAGQQVLLYAEVENFKSEQTSEGPYRTILKSTVDIFDAQGRLVQSMPFAATEDTCGNPRRDYYNSYEFQIPPKIALGPHTLKLTVEDQLSQKVATYTVNFTVK